MKRSLAVSLSVVVLLLGCGRQTQQLVNGVNVSFGAFSLGPTNTYNPSMFFERMLLKFTKGKPFRLGRIDINVDPPMTNVWRYADGKVAEPKAGVIWLKHFGNPPLTPLPIAEQDWFKGIRACLVGPDGSEWEMRPGTGQFYASSKPGVLGYSSWRFSSFPRRNKKLRFRLYERNSAGTWERLLEFTATNPDRTNHPEWTAATLPCASKSGDLEIKLLSATSGYDTISYLRTVLIESSHNAAYNFVRRNTATASAAWSRMACRTHRTNFTLR